MMKLKPCPFCGRKRLKCEPLGDFGQVDDNPILSFWIIQCKCEAQVVAKGKEKTIKIWNKRVKGDK